MTQRTPNVPDSDAEKPCPAHTAFVCLYVRAGGVRVLGSLYAWCSVCMDLTHTLLGTLVISQSLELAKMEMFLDSSETTSAKEQSAHAQCRPDYKTILLRFAKLLCSVMLNSIPEGLGLQATSHVYKLLLSDLSCLQAFVE